jgi:hypothetical protein
MTAVSIWPIVAAALASMLIGYVWFHPRVFGALWMRLINVTPEMAARAMRERQRSTVVALVASMVIAYVMNYFGIAWGVYNVVGGVELGFWCWIGFVAPTLLTQVTWEQRPFSLYLISALYWLASFIAMGVILTL